MPKRSVYAVVNVPPEIGAYATVRFSRSPDSLRESIEWIYRQSAAAASGSAENFLDTYYFQYGHRSIADCGHVMLALEQWSQLMAEEVEDEPLWDGQEQSTRYQDFSRPRFWKPHDWMDRELMERYLETIHELYAGYADLAEHMFRVFSARTPKPPEMKQGDYERTLRARAFDVARYLLPMATLTNVGQTTSIRVLERQICRLLASRYPEIRLLAAQMTRACKDPAYNVARERFLAITEPGRQAIEEAAAEGWLLPARDDSLIGHMLHCLALNEQAVAEALPEVAAAPTLAKYLEPDGYLERTRARLTELAQELLPPMTIDVPQRVDLVPPDDYLLETVTTALYWVTSYSYRQIQQVVRDSLTEKQRQSVLTALFADRRKHDEHLRLFRGGYPLIFDTCVDIGADRDLKRHRRCIQIRQDLSTVYGFEVPPVLADEACAEASDRYTELCERAHRTCLEIARVSPLDALYVLPLGTRRRRLYKMDPVEALYIAELRTGVGGHFSYRSAAYDMYRLFLTRYPYLQKFEDARVTHPSVEAPLKR